MKNRGRGQGVGSGYKPWTTVRDGFTLGFSHRVKGWKTRRLHHFLSNLELSFFYLLEWSEKVMDIREKYPLLPIDNTVDVARRFQLTHPFDNKTGEPVVLTTDFLVEIKLDHGTKLIAFSVKYEKSKTSSKVRTFLERTYWHEKGIEFRVITENDIPRTSMRNIERLHPTKDVTFAPRGAADRMAEIESVLYSKMHKSDTAWANACRETDEKLGLDVGTSLWAVKHLIANRYWLIDITRKLDTAEPLSFERNQNLFHQ
ncbi:TnsA endonuclease C-terminal domain-containing protein [Paenibacillus sp. MBLB4367]|uniref:TnsA endonuclease C-terminal domain-containing protein n=1 Tax=Paenibacillus sp. MBLB4367 TaxID=3384767 RepID=UPI003907F8E8